MGRHGRNSPRAAAPATGHRRPRRRSPVARTGLLGASAAMAVGAVAVVTGFLPTPGSLAGADHVHGDPGSSGNLSRADGTPTPLTGEATGAGATGSGTPGGAAGTASAHASPTRTTARPSTPVSHRPAATATPAATPAHTATAATLAAAPPGGAAAAQVAQVLTLVNQQRAQAGCRPLTANARLAELAGDFSDEMAARGFFDHTDPDGQTPWNRAAALGITNLGGENIAEGQADARAVMTAWMNSPGHRANILDCDYHTIGIGLHYATGSQSGGPWWTQDFGY
ncbi:CAP domain-containing protein [Streptantibioticus silvisoli]|uniref:CAP domain-containing protein n=1 Tax=Streptantibioticus silvisoli TaxID=2705255 RepID=A0ABT6W831_9ACTN|nr:CAP domain-containing protein [Streptantibioticus silvisoli]MDI5966905.1 CAP domain-containing protein [Streptantibioticus silvisoli]